MKRTPRILAIILPLFLLLGGTAALSPLAVISALESQEPDGDVECATQADLIHQLQEQEGGTVTLTGDIVWDDEGQDVFLLQISNPTTVKMGDFSISVPQECALFLDGPIRFEGNGTEQPLFSVDGWLKTQHVEISAKGDGAVAMAIAPHGYWVSRVTEVFADGEQATAVRMEGTDSFTLEMASISATGKDAIGIHADGPLYLKLCSIFSEGVSILSESGEVVLDAAQAEPEPDGAQIIRRKAVSSDRIQDNGICIETGSSRKDLLEKLYDPTFALCDVDGILPPRMCTFGGAVWENLPEDLSKAGDFVATVTVPIPNRFSFELPVLEVPIHVVEPGTPFLLDAQDAGESAFVRFFSKIEEGNATLRYSVDEGNTWKDIMELPDSFLNAHGASVEPLEHNRTYLFQLETKQEGISRLSNILRFHFYDDINQNGGGDRDNGDREDQGETPPHGEIIPPATHLPEEEEPLAPEEPAQPEEGTENPGNEPSPSSGADQGSAPIENKETDENSGQTIPNNSGNLPDATVSVPKAAAPAPHSPDLIENKPGWPSSSKEEAATIQKIPHTATITLTAAQLADQLTANPQGITLLGEGVKVTLPPAIVKNIPLTGGQPFSAELKRESDNRFRVHFWVGNEELTDFGEETFSVGVAYEVTENNPLDFLCENTEGERAVASGYENRKLLFQLSSTGVYTISAPETAKSAEPAAAVLPANREDPPSSPSRLPVWPFVTGGAGILACSLIGGGIFRYKKKQKRRGSQHDR